MAQVTQAQWDAMEAMLAERKRELAAPVRPDAGEPTLDNDLVGSFVDGRDNVTHLYVRVADGGVYRACSPKAPMRSSGAAFAAVGGVGVPGRLPTCSAHSNAYTDGTPGLCAAINRSLLKPPSAPKREPARVTPADIIATQEHIARKRAADDAGMGAVQARTDAMRAPEFPDGHPDGCFCPACVDVRERIAAAVTPRRDALLAELAALTGELAPKIARVAELAALLADGAPVPPTGGPAPAPLSGEIKTASAARDADIASGDAMMAPGETKEERMAWRHNVRSSTWDAILAELKADGVPVEERRAHAEKDPRWLDAKAIRV